LSAPPYLRERRKPSAAAAALGVDGISAGVGTGPDGIMLAWGWEKSAVALEDAQFTLGQGPGPDAVVAGAPAPSPRTGSSTM
jgi:hypothetical protein